MSILMSALAKWVAAICLMANLFHTHRHPKKTFWDSTLT